MGIKMNLSGFDKLQKDLKQLEKAMTSLDGTIANIQFDPEDENSVRGAIREMEQAVDRKVLPYRSNHLVADVVKEAKAQFKKGILEKAKESKS